MCGTALDFILGQFFHLIEKNYVCSLTGLVHDFIFVFIFKRASIPDDRPLSSWYSRKLSLD